MSNVDEIYQDVSGLFEFLRCQEQLEFLKFVDNSSRKLLLISAASYFEKRLSDFVIQLAEGVTSNDHVLVNLIRRTAVERQYHTWFAWDARNANKFFSIFGGNFKDFAQKKISENESKIYQSRIFWKSAAKEIEWCTKISAVSLWKRPLRR